MRHRLTVGLLLAVLPAAAARAEIKTSEIKIKSGDEEITAFVAEPAGKGPFPGIVVIQEWWGLNDWIRDNARHLAEQGYVAVAPDLYRGKVTTERAVAKTLRIGLPKDRAIRDLKAAADYLAAKGNVDKNRLGSIGWCMGGQYSLLLALDDPRIKAAAIAYGALVTEADALKPLNAAVLGVFGEADMGIPPKQVKEFEAALKAAGKTNEGLHIYPKAGHGFMRPAGAAGIENPAYDEKAAKDAWAKIDAFFAKTLGGK